MKNYEWYYMHQWNRSGTLTHDGESLAALLLHNALFGKGAAESKNRCRQLLQLLVNGIVTLTRQWRDAFCLVTGLPGTAVGPIITQACQHLQDHLQEFTKIDTLTHSLFYCLCILVRLKNDSPNSLPNLTPATACLVLQLLSPIMS